MGLPIVLVTCRWSCEQNSSLNYHRRWLQLLSLISWWNWNQKTKVRLIFKIMEHNLRVLWLKMQSFFDKQTFKVRALTKRFQKSWTKGYRWKLHISQRSLSECKRHGILKTWLKWGPYRWSEVTVDENVINWFKVHMTKDTFSNVRIWLSQVSQIICSFLIYR